ncbi:MAG: hypothetical protein JXM70_21045 [Pirellulales bacterium]|nr:hypothetical protein [Pirellulales bacterium]
MNTSHSILTALQVLLSCALLCLVMGDVLSAVAIFLKLNGKSSRDVVLMGNDFSRVGKIADRAAEIPAGALSLTGNRIHTKM